MSARFNNGIVAAVTAGIVRNVSVMVYGSAVEVEKICARDIALGVHLELPSGATVEDVEAQVQHFHTLFDRLPDYLDGHQHCHITPENIASVIAVAQAHHLPVRSRYAEDRSVLRRHAIATPDHFISWHPTRTQKLMHQLAENTCAVTELVTHPGYYDAQCSYPYNQQREEELVFITDDVFRTLIRDNYQLVRYDYLHNQKKESMG